VLSRVRFEIVEFVDRAVSLFDGRFEHRGRGRVGVRDGDATETLARSHVGGALVATVRLWRVEQ
jgi:hypothetical protein